MTESTNTPIDYENHSCLSRCHLHKPAIPYSKPNRVFALDFAARILSHQKRMPLAQIASSIEVKQAF